MSIIDVLVNEYETSGLDGIFCLLQPDATPSVMSEDGDMFVAPHDETADGILDRIERSKRAGRNLFVEEWKKYEPKPGRIYRCAH